MPDSDTETFKFTFIEQLLNYHARRLQEKKEALIALIQLVMALADPALSRTKALVTPNQSRLAMELLERHSFYFRLIPDWASAPVSSLLRSPYSICPRTPAPLAIMPPAQPEVSPDKGQPEDKENTASGPEPADRH